MNRIEGTSQGLYIGGRWRAAAKGGQISSVSPLDGKPWYTVADAEQSDVDSAADAARRTFESRDWQLLTRTQRGEMLRVLAAGVREHAEELAYLESRDNGKLLRESSNQIHHAANIYDYYAGIADKLTGSTTAETAPEVLSFTLREPLGVVAVIIPWNSPMYLLSCSLGPAFAMGNTIVVKPSEHASASCLLFAKIVESCEYPAGAFNLITGGGPKSGSMLAAHGGVDKVAFTGGSRTGRSVAASAALHTTPTILELGGKSPHVVFEDADLERAVNGLVAGVFAAGGQTCTAGSRCLVARKVFQEVSERLVARTKQIVIGDPMVECTELGPLALLSQRNNVESIVHECVTGGATVLAGGRRPTAQSLENGWYYEPTIVAGAGCHMRITREEVFGPVATISPFDDFDEALAMANDTDYGLAAGVWTSNIDTALKFARRVNAGMVWINTYRMGMFTTPGGGFKGSGYGKRNGHEGTIEYSRLKSVIVDHSGITQDPFIMRVK